MPSEKSPKQQGNVWLSISDKKADLVFGFVSRLFEEDFDTLVARQKAFDRGVAFPADELPAEMWISARAAQRDDERRLPHLFSAGGFLTVSSDLANVLRGLDLGQTRLQPVKLLHSDRREAFAGEYFLLNIAEVHRYFSPDHSARFKPLASHLPYVASVGNSIEDGDISVVPAALSGPDLWIDDTLLTQFFCSDRLVQALRAAKLASRLPLFRCRVLDDN